MERHLTVGVILVRSFDSFLGRLLRFCLRRPSGTICKGRAVKGALEQKTTVPCITLLDLSLLFLGPSRTPFLTGSSVFSSPVLKSLILTVSSFGWL